MMFILKFFRQRIVSGIRHSRVKAFVFFICLLWYTSSAFLYFELDMKPDLGWADAVWWSVVTMATVGYGDLFPTTFMGRFLAGIPAIIIGIGFLGYIITAVASRLVETRSRRIQGMCESSFSNHVIIFNFTRLEEIVSVITGLQSDILMKKKGICLVDESLAELPPALCDLGVQFIKGNPTDEDVLSRAGLASASHAIILCSDRYNHHSDDQNLVTVMVIEKINPSIFTVVEVIDKRKKKQFKLAGANDIVCIGEFSVSLITREVLDPGVNAVMLDLAGNESGSEMYIIPVVSSSEKNYRDLQLVCVEKNISVIGIFRDGGHILNCPNDFILKKDDKAIVVSAERWKEICL